MHKLFSPKKKPILIGEVSCNNNGNISNAKKIIDVAKKYKVDFIKLQTYSASSLTIKWAWVIQESQMWPVIPAISTFTSFFSLPQNEHLILSSEVFDIVYFLVNTSSIIP